MTGKSLTENQRQKPVSDSTGNELKENQVVIPLDEYRELLTAKIKLDMLREDMEDKSYLSDIQRAVFGIRNNK
ncbi:MAG: hypothetical protein IJ740_08415 [Ruminococcus sp.]|nr:hypothetical protein [Ruminococcus sp.]